MFEAFVSLGGTEEEVIFGMHQGYTRGVDGFEIRGDKVSNLTEPIWQGLIRYQPCPGDPKKKLITLRNDREAAAEPGQGFQGTEEERARWYNLALETGYVDLIDIEYAHPLLEVKIPRGVRKISSNHEFEDPFTSVNKLHDLYEAMAKERPDIIKIVAPAQTQQHAEIMNQFIEEIKGRRKERPGLPAITGICMGQHGQSTRKNPYNAITYCCLEKGDAVAPGQLTVEEAVAIRDAARG